MYQKIGWLNFDELQVNDSTLNEGTNTRVMSELDRKGWFIMHHTTGNIKLAMAVTQEWWCLFPPLLVAILIEHTT